MWKIRRPKNSGRTTPQSGVIEPPNYDVPRWGARQCVLLLRVTHLAFDEMARIVEAMPPDQKSLYQYLTGVDVRPSFFDLMKLIALSEERGFLSPDEAAEIRAGRVRGIENPIPDIERTGDDAQA